jgi:hypothetical protein
MENKKINREHWSLPKGKKFWVLFDIVNGGKEARRYLWWFDTKKEAMEHKKWQHAKEYGAKLYGPVCVVADKL